MRGFFPVEEVKNLRQIDSMLQGHPDMKTIPGIDFTTGSLGLGVSAICGMALAGKIAGKSYRNYVILGDGESEEGQVWEAAMFAAHYKLDNLCAIVDSNKLQIDGFVTDVINPVPFEEKFRAFGWNVVSINGHDFADIERGFEAAKACKGKPTVIIADTIKGCGVSFMENEVGWHGVAPKQDQYEQAVKEITDAVASL